MAQMSDSITTACKADGSINKLYSQSTVSSYLEFKLDVYSLRF